MYAHFIVFSTASFDKISQLTKEEGALDFASHTAIQLHNKVRAFAGWPGTSARFALKDKETGENGL